MLSQTEKNLIISSTFTTTTNISSIIIPANVNTHSPLWYSLTEDHKKELIEDILLNFNHITLNINTPICLPLNKTQQSTLPDITTVSANLHNCTSWQTIHSLTFDHLSLLTTLSMYTSQDQNNSLSLQ